VLNRRSEDPHGILWVGLAVDLEGLVEGVCGVVGLVEVRCLDGGGAFEGLAGFFVCSAGKRG
jgi:hypothetical protein